MMKIRGDLFRGCLTTAIAVLLFLTSHTASAELIRSFDAEITLNADASFRVTEVITMDFEQEQRHGIFRMIPIHSMRGGRPASINVDVDSVGNARGGAIPYKLSREGAYLKIRIGSPTDFVTGLNTYRISYDVRGAVRTYNGKPEVYWNVTGDKWPYPILAATARFVPPPGVPIKDVQVRGFRGYEGSQEAPEIKRLEDHVLYSTGNLNPSEGLTIVAQVPEGTVQVPVAGRVVNLLGGVASIAILPLLALAWVFRRWSVSGRDAVPMGAAGVEWDPPKDLSPAEVGALVDEKCDMADIVSTVVDLAARGFLRIEALESQKFLFFSSKDYRFVRTEKPSSAEPLAKHEKRFLLGLFSGHDTYGEEVLLSELRNKFYTHLSPIRSAIYESLTQRGMFTGNPDTVRKWYLFGGLVLLIVSGFTLMIFPFTLFFLRLGGVLAGLVLMLAARAMPSKTVIGCEKLREAVGFQRFVRTAEKRRIEVLAKDDPTIFGRMLPYAMVLGVADEWANAFQDLLREPPDWYVSHQPGMFSSRAFISDLGGGMNSMSSAFSSTPSSSGGSGMSGGGGGGGGFGGGGGGSW